jgi:hypothetical protein
VVIGEPVRVPSTSAAGPSTFGLPVHVLNFAPLDYYSNEQVASGVYETVQVYNAQPLTRVGSPPTSPDQYQVDYSSGIFTFYNSTGYQYKIDYSWVDGEGLHTRVGEWTRPVLGPTYTYRVDPSPAGAHPATGWGGIIERSERVYRLLPYDPALGSGSYWIDPNAGRVTGIVYFNPDVAGANLKIDYRVADWAILREDVQVPADSLNPEGLGGLVKLAITNIRGPGFVSPPRYPTPYLKLHPDLPDNAFLVAIDLGSGKALVNGPAVTDTSSGGSFVVNYKTGELYFNSASIPSRSGRSYRVFYRGQDDWGVQAAKANANYASLGMADWDKFSRNVRTLTFADSEVGKSVLVDYRYYDTGTGRYRVVQGELHRINDNGQIVLRNTPESVQRVRGVSFDARVSWVGQGSIRAKTAAGAPGSYLNEAWRQVTVDSYLTRPASEQ